MCIRIPVLKREKKSKRPDFDEDEEISINANFTSRGKRININQYKPIRGKNFKGDDKENR